MEKAIISRRSFLAASAAAAVPSAAVAGAAVKTSRHPPSLETQLNDCVAQLQAILMQMHPEVSGSNHYLQSRGDGSFHFSVQGRRKFIEYDGPGLYRVSGRVNEVVECWLERFNHVDIRTGEAIAGCFYFSSVFVDGETTSEEVWNYTPKILRKLRDGFPPAVEGQD